jgi:hypothetical protein
MRKSSWFLMMTTAVIGISLAPRSITGQATAQVRRSPSELLADLAGGRNERASAAGLAITHVLAHRTQYAAGDVDALLQGLERLAITGSEPQVRAEAAARLAIPGARSDAHPLLGTLARLQRVYAASRDPLVRGVIVGTFGDLAERREAIRFAEDIASRSPEDFTDAASRVIASLLMMGDEGRASLARLNESKSVKDPEAAHSLVLLARTGYRAP